MYKNRPFPVTLICLYLLSVSVYRMATSFAWLDEASTQAFLNQIQVPYDLQVAMLYLNWIVTIVAAMFIMQEKNWARWLYLGWGFVAIDYNLCIQPLWQANVMPVAVWLVCAFILLLPSSNEFFTEEEYWRPVNR